MDTIVLLKQNQLHLELHLKLLIASNLAKALCSILLLLILIILAYIFMSYICENDKHSASVFYPDHIDLPVIAT